MLRRIPYVIDNDQHKLGDVLNQVLDDHTDLALDIASAYFNIRGYAILRDRLKRVGNWSWRHTIWKLTRPARRTRCRLGVARLWSASSRAGI